MLHGVSHVEQDQDKQVIRYQQNAEMDSALLVYWTDFLLYKQKEFNISVGFMRKFIWLTKNMICKPNQIYKPSYFKFCM